MTNLLYLCNPFTRVRQPVENIDLQRPLSDFKDVVCARTGIQTQDQELIYMGECLVDEKRSLTSYGIQHNFTVFVIEKEKELDDEHYADTHTLPSVEEIRALLKKAKNPIYRQSVKKIIKDCETLQTFLKDTVTDYVTGVLLKDADLLLAVIDSAPAEKIEKEYPNLGVVLKHIVDKVSSTSPSNRMPLFHGDDNDEYEGLDPALLAQAELLAAGESNLQQQQQPANSQLRHQISASDLANALSFATMSQSAGGSSSRPSNDSQMESALEQMRAVGITDAELSRRALTMSEGNVEAAINLIFEGSL
ncbi:uncharacterized protein LOC130646119 [Hydractinia symbiolongicarpus]|uniref:uncharacterized protein LOC130646119 n=1 Tax=Hydractinia symbiolongicarpus TaxID=13093 RepID=UPI00254EC14F|nr:uncharacterized protein LOC130646119 [Hydractinia symbiolongicarpus]